MENYTKGQVIECPDPLPFDVDEALQMRMNSNSKMHRVLSFAMNKMKSQEVRQITWNGSGLSVPKAISCAEIMKRRLKVLHQITKIRFKRIEEHWTPNEEGLEPLKVNRDIPSISILLSKDELDTSEPGYQPPGKFETFWQEKTSSNPAGQSGDAKHKRSSRPSGQKNPGKRPRHGKPQTSSGSNPSKNGRKNQPSEMAALPSVDNSSKDS